MALPKLDTPIYTLELPSTGEKLDYRPFLVKEQKIMLMVQDEAGVQENSKTMQEILNSCTFNKIDIQNTPVFDIEYLFLQIRAKSVGSKIELNLTCPDDKKTKVPVEINIDEVSVHVDETHTNEIQVTEDIKVIMSYPSLETSKNIDTTSSEKAFEIVSKCIQEVHHGEVIHNKSDLSLKEVNEFLESFSIEQFEKITNFFQTMPKIRHFVSVTNPNTDITSEIVLEGLDTFLA
tara:strand:+ start:1195 stop:1896 length:702 start_codon:yes stop_codon:yes gene_type:complete